jgi:hypothetical protein
MHHLIELSVNCNLQQNTMMKVENDVDVQSEENSSDIKIHEVYVPSSFPIEEIKSEVSLVLGVFYIFLLFS